LILVLIVGFPLGLVKIKIFSVDINHKSQPVSMRVIW